FMLLFSTIIVTMLTVLLAVVPMYLVSGQGWDHLELRSLNRLVRVFLLLSLGLLCLSAGLRAAAGIAREREQRTLDGLLTLPVERQAILSAKWLGSIVWAQGFVWSLALIVAMGLVTLTLHPL